ncbi:MAG: hypothetical protein M3373_11325 [Gemmatimonadota bacterium]|nr:hypothetical protein [Gemmatimonadota bacterium]
MSKRRVRESAPIQVYLAASEQARLDRLAEQLETTKSAIVRRGLLALEREILDPLAHPALRLIGLGSGELAAESPADAAREHDRVLADHEEAAWRPLVKTKARKRGR